MISYLDFRKQDSGVMDEQDDVPPDIGSGPLDFWASSIGAETGMIRPRLLPQDVVRPARSAASRVGRTK